MPKRKQTEWIPKEALRITFKGRKPRALLWRKAVYKEWFEYAKLSGDYPSEFGDLSTFKNFEEWWRHPQYGAELFLEPFYEKSVAIADADFKANNMQLLVNVDMSRTRKQLKADFHFLLEKHHIDNKYIAQAPFQPSKLMSAIRLYDSRYEHNNKKDLPIKLNHPRKVYVMMEKDVSREDIALKMGYFSGYDKSTRITVTDNEVYKWRQATKGRRNKNTVVFDTTKDSACANRFDSALRRVSRNRQQCELIFAHIAHGTVASRKRNKERGTHISTFP